MALILRCDVDKPYGRKNLFSKILSKLRENYYFPALQSLGYLKDTTAFSALIAKYKIPGYFYFRNCTYPPPEVSQFMSEAKQLIGFHAEATQSEESFLQELEQFRKKVKGSPVNSFTKHGSGILKLGKNHYPPYEEKKYLEWSHKHKISFLFGNGIVENDLDIRQDENVYPKMVWIEAEYRNTNKHNIEWIVETASQENIVILIHPENYYAISQARTDFNNLLRLAKEKRVPWISL